MDYLIVSKKSRFEFRFFSDNAKERLVKFGDVEIFIFVWVSCSFIFKTTEHPSKNDRSGTWVPSRWTQEIPKGGTYQAKTTVFWGDMMTSSSLAIPSSSHPNAHIDCIQVLSMDYEAWSHKIHLNKTYTSAQLQQQPPASKSPTKT